MRFPATIRVLTLSLPLVAAGCSSGSGGSTKNTPDFAIESIGVLQGQEWKINRSLDIVFNQAVDFSTVSLNTINIVDEFGNGATGIFTQPSDSTGAVMARVVRFQPTCPTEDDNSDAGLQPGRLYQLSVLGSKTGGMTVRNAAGEPLENGALVTFHTPDSTDALVLFLDTVPGPPAIRVRGAGGVQIDDLNATHVLIGGQPVYFRMNLLAQEGQLDHENFGEVNVPLNHYSIPENQVQVVVHLNQPVLARSDNVSSDKLGLEYFDGVVWQDVQTEVQLLANCTETGATVLLVPRGILPQHITGIPTVLDPRNLRFVMRQGFKDITGDETMSDVSNSAVMVTVAADGQNPLFPGVANPEVDEILDSFDLSGEDFGSLEDTESAFAVPRANWGGGVLEASFGFNGTGGPDGDFDWHIPPATELILSTITDTIFGGPGGTPSTSQAVIGGVIDVRDVFIPASSRLILLGPNTVRILASGEVKVLGEISVRGSDNPGVATLDTTNQPELGAKGQVGGGDGGTGSFLTSQSTPRGGRGNGMFNALNGGGEGGETGFAKGGPDNRRGAGGGGGKFGPDVFYRAITETGKVLPLFRCQTVIGLDGEPGAPGSATGLGAESQSERAQGGEIGPGPFDDDDEENDFLGVRVVDLGGPDEAIVQGELDRVGAGSGGGAGGDAVSSNSFPLIPFTIIGDEKGAGGGGGGGGLEILAIGLIQIGDDSFTGSLAAEGGSGGGGENTGFFDRVGGGSGGGSGGHIVLSSATGITIYGRAESATEDPFNPGNWWYADNFKAPEGTMHDPRPISAVGGQGGAGRENKGGSKETGDTEWICDRIPWAFSDKPEANPKLGIYELPPFNQFCYTPNILNDYFDLEGGPVVGAGGDGSPGLIQFHVEDPAIQLSFPDLEPPNGDQTLFYHEGLDVTPVCAPPPVGWTEPGVPPDTMIPFFGKTSIAQSKWIALGLARVNPGGSDDQIMLRFEGIDVADGIVPHDGSVVNQLDPIIGNPPDDLGGLGVGPLPYIDTDLFTLVFDASGLAGADLLYKDNPALLRSFTVELVDEADPLNNFQRFAISSVSYDAALDRLNCHVDPSGPALTSFAGAGDVQASLRPHWFRVLTSGIADSYPSDTAVEVMFNATKIDPLTGGPDEDVGVMSGLTPDIGQLNLVDWDFVRFQVIFNLDVDGDGVNLSTPTPGLAHLRISYDF